LESEDGEDVPGGQEEDPVGDWVERITEFKPSQPEVPVEPPVTTPMDEFVRAMTQAFETVTLRGGGAEKSTKYLARQSTPKELPPFSGDPEDWPIFCAEF